MPAIHTHVQTFTSKNYLLYTLATISGGSKEKQSKTNESTRRWASVGSVILVMLTIILVLVIRRKKGSCTIRYGKYCQTLIKHR